MSEYSAKSLREKMKAKARSLAGEKDQKVDSSDWTPAKPLDASVKTGARPIMKPSAKGIGESNAARDTKAAIGNPKRGAFKSGGAVKDAGIKDKKALGAIDPSPKRGAAQHYKKGGKIGKDDGGIVSKLNKLVGYKSPAQKLEEGLSGVGKGRTSSYSSSDKAALGDIAKGGSGSGLPSDETEFGKSQNYKKGGRTGRATGGLIGAMKGAKKNSKKAAKTDINIVINAGHKTPMRHPAAGPMPPVGGDGMPPMPPAGVGAPPPAMPMGAPPAPPPGAGPGLPLPGRKAGGRITKTASSYKDMEAGAASGEGRLQKTEIAKKGKDAPARKEGGRITKVAKSYKDMEAGAASGEGRLQKTDIAEAKKGRGK